MYAYVADGNGPDEITLPDVYSYSPVGALIPLPKVWMHNTVKVHAWTGAEEGGKGSGDSTEPEEMVFVTESGSVYHTKAGCRYHRCPEAVYHRGEMIMGRNTAHVRPAADIRTLLGLFTLQAPGTVTTMMRPAVD